MSAETSATVVSLRPRVRAVPEPAPVPVPGMASKPHPSGRPDYFTRAMWFAWLLRSDVRADARLDNAEAQRDFVAWWILSGAGEYPRAWTCEPVQVSVALEPVPMGDGEPWPRLLRYLWRSRPDLQASFPLEELGTRDALLAWYRDHGQQEFPAAPLYVEGDEREGEPRIRLAALPFAMGYAGAGNLDGVTAASPPRRPRGRPRRFGVNLVGYTRGELGIGEDVRAMSASLAAAGIGHVVVDAGQPGNARQEDTSLVGAVVGEPRYPVTIFCLTPADTARLLLERGPGLFEAAYRIGSWAWELPEVPPALQEIFGLVDEVWAHSAYSLAALKAAGAGEVRLMAPSVALPEVVDRHREALGPAAAAEFAFLCPFDPHSHLARKNPIACVTAFKAAFPEQDSGTALVLRVNGDPHAAASWPDVEREIAGDPRISVLAGTLDRSEALAVLAASDCLVSAHRAEGFGRNIAEAVLLGVPVIATGFSGPIDYLEPEEMVRWRPRVIAAIDYPFGEGLSWADPDVEHLTAMMREARARKRLHLRLSKKLTQRARQVQAVHGIAVSGRRYAERIRAVFGLLNGQATALPAPDASPSADIHNPAEDTTVNDMAPKLDGWVDKIEARTVQGWVCDLVNAESRLTVTALVDGRPVASAVANRVRGDLAERHLGQGDYGYAIDLDLDEVTQGRPLVLQGAGQDPVGNGETLTLQVVAEVGEAKLPLPFAAGALRYEPGPSREVRSNTATELAGPSPTQAPASEAQAQGQLVWFDVTDLIHYLWHHRHVTGIQRVQCGFIANIVERPEAPERYRFCVRSWDAADSADYGEIPHRSIAEIVWECAAGTITDASMWRRFMSRSREAADATPARMGYGDILYILGAPWVVPDYYLPIARMKRDIGLRCIQLVYDVIPTVMPDVCADGVIDGFNRAIAGVIAYADAVFAISDYTARDFAVVAREAGRAVPPAGVVPMGGSMSYLERAPHPAPRRQGSPYVGSIAARPYVLCVGTLEPRKNHSYLFNVWRRLVKEMGERAPDLVCVGRPGWHMENFFRQLEVTGYLDNKFKVLSDVSDADLDALYGGCLFTVFPSIFEGWGLPVSESLAAGKVPVVSEATSLPEAGGDLAVYVDPYNAGEGYAVIRGLVDDPEKVRALERRIREEYRPPSWTEATAKLLEGIDALSQLREPVEPIQIIHAGGGVTTVRPPTLQEGRCYSFAVMRGARDPQDKIREEFGFLEAYAFLHGTGWHKPEPWGVWASGRDAHLLMRLDAGLAASQPFVYAELCVPHGFGERRLSVTANGIKVMSADIRSSAQTYRFGIPPVAPPETGTGHHDLHLTFSLDSVLEPIDEPDGDRRTLGVGIAALQVCRPHDVLARLEVIERKLFKVSEYGPALGGAVL